MTHAVAAYVVLDETVALDISAIKIWWLYVLLTCGCQPSKFVAWVFWKN